MSRAMSPGRVPRFAITQRPSLVCTMDGNGDTVSRACRQVWRNTGAWRITHDMRSTSVHFATASWMAHDRLLPLPRTPAIEQRRDNGHGELLASDVVGVPHLGGDRRQIVLPVGGRIVATIHHDAPERQVHQVGALEVGPGAIVAEGGHARHDQGGKLLHQGVRTQP